MRIGSQRLICACKDGLIQSHGFSQERGLKEPREKTGRHEQQLKVEYCCNYSDRTGHGRRPAGLVSTAVVRLYFACVQSVLLTPFLFLCGSMQVGGFCGMGVRVRPKSRYWDGPATTYGRLVTCRHAADFQLPMYWGSDEASGLAKRSITVTMYLGMPLSQQNHVVAGRGVVASARRQQLPLVCSPHCQCA